MSRRTVDGVETVDSAKACLALHSEDSQTEDTYLSCEEEKADTEEDDKYSLPVIPALPVTLSPTKIIDFNSNQLPVGFNLHGDYPSSSVSTTTSRYGDQNLPDDAVACLSKVKMGVGMVQPVTTSQYLKISGVKLDRLPLKKLKLSDFPKSIHPTEVVLDRPDLALPIPIHEHLEGINVKKGEINVDMMLEKFKKKMLLKKKIKEEGLVHKGDRMGEVPWISLGEKEEEMTKSDWREEGFNYNVPDGVGRRTRASTRFRNSLQGYDSGLDKTVGEDVFDFNEANYVEVEKPETSLSVSRKYNFDVNEDDDDFVDDVVDEDYEVENKKAKKGKAKGSGKRGVNGRGRGKCGKKSKPDNIPSVEEYFSPLQSKDVELEEEEMSPLTAACNRPGVSGYSQEFRRNSLPRTRSRSVERVSLACPICSRVSDNMRLLQIHAAYCSG